MSENENVPDFVDRFFTIIQTLPRPHLGQSIPPTPQKHAVDRKKLRSTDATKGSHRIAMEYPNRVRPQGLQPQRAFYGSMGG